MLQKNRLLPAIFILLFALACYFPLFLHLDHMSVRLWDEARRAVNAFEMAHDGNLLVTHYNGQPEMWGTKPPLLIWCQAFFMKIIGYNEVALRLPSALAALATVVLLVLFSWKVLKRPLAGFLAGLVLLTTKGYVVHGHVARSGDFDSLLTLWETGYLLSFFTFLCQTDFAKKRKWLYITAGFIALAGLTKGVAGFFFLPGIALFFVLHGLFSEGGKTQLAGFFRWKHTWLALLVAVVPVAAFYLLREVCNPGYLAAVQQNELGGRYLVPQFMHEHPWWHYFKELWELQFRDWLPFLPLGLLVGFWEKGRLRTCTALLLLHSVAFFCVVSSSQTRIVWYMAPVYPSLALLVGIGFERLVRSAGMALSRSPGGQLAVLAAFVFGMFFVPYHYIIKRVYQEQHPARDWHEVKYRDFMRKTKDVKDYAIVHQFYNSHVVFYANVFNEKGYQIRHQALQDFDFKKFEFGKGPLDFPPGDTLMVCETAVFEKLNAVYKYETLRKWEGCKLLKITARRAEPAPSD
ncbi:MAG: glycosyltransferase family 39 protein [Bacteroidetes bacterium]|nr:glycosyltransferase family 39 protein [Bacteroidota bacterium]